jgi:hypothetical protein
MSQQRRAEVEQTRRTADAARVAAIAAVDSDIAVRRAHVERALADLAVAHAPGPFGAGFDGTWMGGAPLAGAPALVRRGATAAGPALYPLFHDRGWYLQGPPELTLAEIHTLILRCVAGLPLKRMRVDVFDPRIEGRLGVFAPLRSAHAATFPQALTSPGALVEALESAAGLAAGNAEAIAAAHATDLGDLWRTRGTPSGEYRIVVVLNYPEGVDRAAQELLVRLARSGGPNGVSLVVQADDGARPADDDVRPQDLRRHLRTSRAEPDGRLLLSDYPEVMPVALDGTAPPGLVDEVIAIAVARAAEDTGPVVPLSELIAADVADPWTGDATLGLEATIGRAGQRPLTLGRRSQNPPIANVLIGGAVGQGKSNLLLDLVYALATRYGPDELELHLLDFKSGLEFQRFAADASGTGWLPHAKVLCLESDKGFGVAVLRHVVAELERRSALFKSAGASGIDDYRRSGHRLPRLLLVIDEFQVLFDGQDGLTDEAVGLLERLARQGRASGVHLVLSSQTTSGVSGLRTKGESIFAQFPVRISLKNTVIESEAILSPGNRAAADLTYRGEIIVNRNFGHDPQGSNERAICAFADDRFLRELQTDLWRRHPSGPAPMVFVPTDFARWPEVEPAQRPGRPAIGLVGRPVAVTDEPVALEVDDDVDQTVAVVGSDERLAVPTLAGLARSLATTLGVGRVLVLDLTAAEPASAGSAIAATLEVVAARGVEVRRFDRDGSVRALTEVVRPSLTGGGPRTLVVGLGWQRWHQLDELFPISPDDEYGTYRFGDLLHQVATRGALHGVHLLAWWTSLRQLEEQLGFRYEGVRHFVTARMSAEDYRGITSAVTPLVEGHPRVAHIDRAADGGPVVAVPFDLEDRT